MVLMASAYGCVGDLNSSSIDRADATPAGAVDGAPNGTSDSAVNPGDGGIEPAVDASGGPLIDQLVALTESCDRIGGDYASDEGSSSNIPICGLQGAVFWRADMDIDCDGQSTDVCNSGTDPWYQPQTSMGDHIAASELPFVVIPLPSSRFDYEQHDIDLGTVVAVIYDGQLRYGAFVDQGPEEIIGEASYAMAELMGVDPDPEFGGTEGPVLYIAFTGADAMVPESSINDHSLAESIGEEQALELVADN